MGFDARVAQQNHIIAAFADGFGEAQPVGAVLHLEAFAVIGRYQNRARQAGQHNAAVIQLGAAGNRLVGGGFDLCPAFAAIGRAPDIAAHAEHQKRAVCRRQAAPERAVIAGFNRLPIAAAIDRFINRAELGRNIDIALIVGEQAVQMEIVIAVFHQSALGPAFAAVFGFKCVGKAAHGKIVASWPTAKPV